MAFSKIKRSSNFQATSAKLIFQLAKKIRNIFSVGKQNKTRFKYSADKIFLEKVKINPNHIKCILSVREVGTPQRRKEKYRYTKNTEQDFSGC